MTDVLIVSTALEDSVSVVLSETSASGALLFVTVAFEVVLLSTTVLGAKVSDTFLTFERRGYFPW